MLIGTLKFDYILSKTIIKPSSFVLFLVTAPEPKRVFLKSTSTFAPFLRVQYHSIWVLTQYETSPLFSFCKIAGGIFSTLRKKEHIERTAEKKTELLVNDCCCIEINFEKHPYFVRSSFCQP